MANITCNTVSGNEYTGVPPYPQSGPDPTVDTQADGILIYNGGSGTIVSRNKVDGNDIGIEAFGPNTIVSNNTLGFKTANRFEGILVDQGNATISGNIIHGGNLGIAVYSYVGDTGNSVATISNNDVDNADVGVQVFTQQPGNTFTALATILNNDLSFNNTGINVDGGKALVQGNDLRYNIIGLLVQDGALVDAGQKSTNTNFTGLGISKGKNDFSSYRVPATSTSGAIVDLVLGAGATNVWASNNYWNKSFHTPADVESVIWDYNDDPTLGMVEVDNVLRSGH